MHISNYTFFTLTAGGLALFATNTTTAQWNSDINPDKQSETVLENGIIFNYESKTLLAEKFIPIEFLIPFPKFQLNIRDELDIFLKQLAEMWKQPSLFCHVDFSSNFTKNDSTFDVDWLLHQVKNEVKLKNEVLGRTNIQPHFFMNNNKNPI